MSTEQTSGVSISLLCSLSGYTRQAYYKQRQHKANSKLQEELVIQQVTSYREVQKVIGTRKLHWLLFPFYREHGIRMGRDALFDLLRFHSLLIGKKRPYKPKTTDSNHRMKKYPNLIKDTAPITSGGLIVTDITYIDLCEGNSYLSLVTDAYSRKIVGYHLSDQLTAAGPVVALEMAILSYGENVAGLIHHSDRGSQYCSHEYTEILKDREISISMTQSGDPRDNAIAERVNGILKTELLEEVYPNISIARAAIAQAVNAYNYLRPHTSIDMLTPAIAHSKSSHLKRHWKSFYQRKLDKEAVMDG
jgi:transposase InsO family protein